MTNEVENKKHPTILPVRTPIKLIRIPTRGRVLDTPVAQNEP